MSENEITQEPHRYVAEGGNNRWRTCKLCGRGANASIHRQPQSPLRCAVCGGLNPGDITHARCQ